MSRIAKRFEELRGRGEGALVPFLVAGDPDPGRSLEVAAAVAEHADVLELGIPFSDPVADGKVNELAYLRALRHGAFMPRVLELAAALRRRSQVPLVLMTYYNPVLQFGLSRFAAEAAGAGVDGVLVTDLPPEEAGPWQAAAGEAGVDTIFLVAPTSSSRRIRLAAEAASGYVYCVSRTGVTGARAELPAELGETVRGVRAHTAKPLVVGFGISTPEQVRAVCKLADGAVVGSALVAAAAGAGDRAARVAGDLVARLKAATRPEGKWQTRS